MPDICTQLRYDFQAIMYPSQVLEPICSCTDARPMVLSIKDARKMAGLSQEGLGELAGSGRSTIVKLERGELPLTPDWVRRLAPHLKVQPHEIFEAAPLPNEEEMHEIVAGLALEVPPGAPTSVWIDTVAQGLRGQLARFQVDRLIRGSEDQMSVPAGAAQSPDPTKPSAQA